MLKILLVYTHQWRWSSEHCRSTRMWVQHALLLYVTIIKAAYPNYCVLHVPCLPNVDSHSHSVRQLTQPMSNLLRAHLSPLSGSQLQELIDCGRVSSQHSLHFDNRVTASTATKLAPGQRHSIVCVHLLPFGCLGHPTQLRPVLRACINMFIIHSLSLTCTLKRLWK